MLLTCSTYQSKGWAQGVWSPYHTTDVPCLPTFVISVPKPCSLPFWKLTHFNRGVIQPHQNFWSWLFIQGWLCLILYTTWTDRTILSQLQENFCLPFCCVPWAMVAVPGITCLRSLAWHCWHHAGVQSTTRSKTALTGTEGKGFVFLHEEAVVLTECFMLP